MIQNMEKNITATDFKKILIEQRKEYQSYLGAAMEEFASQVAVIAESVMKLTEATQRLRDQVAALMEMVAQNTVDITDIKAELHIIRGDLKQKADREELLAIERRVARLTKSRRSQGRKRRTA